MTAVSDRTSDTFSSDAKARVREANLTALQEAAPELFTDDGKLRGSWLELMGETGRLTLELLESRGVIGAGQFVGIDLDSARIDRFRADFPAHRWLAGDLLDLVQRPELEDVVAINFDAYDLVNSSKLVSTGCHLRTLVRRSLARFGVVAVIWNADLDGVRCFGTRLSVALRRHTERLVSVFQDPRDPGRAFPPTEVLPEGAEDSVDDARFTGQVGAYEVYRGKSTGHRMANVRLVLR